MGQLIEDYALIGDLHTTALVGKNGSIDWFCVPRFDSPACFAALLGDDNNGCWLIAPAGPSTVTRAYRKDTLVLETRYETPEGAVTLIDFMPLEHQEEDCRRIIRIVRGESGRVPMKMILTVRFDYGRTVPWVRRQPFGLSAVSGPNSIELHTPVVLENAGFRTRATFEVAAGENIPFLLLYSRSGEMPDDPGRAQKLADGATAWWQEWVSNAKVEGPWRDQVVRSLITLKALTHVDSGGILAAATTSLPEHIGGSRNWDYRYCWLRDATFSLYSLLMSGLTDEALKWRDWLLRVAAGMPSQLQAIYGPSGEHMLPEFEIDWLPGYEGSNPVRVGNAAHRQLQIDVYGEIMDVFHTSRRAGIDETEDSWQLQKALLDFLESGWRKVDSGIWEVRGPERHFTHSKVMAWAGVDRAIQGVEQYGLSDDNLDRWRALRKLIHDETCRRAFDPERNAFMQYFGADALDASLLQIPMVGFLPATDPRVLGTVKAIEEELRHGDFIRRYTLDKSIDGLADSEGAFLPCTFWLADNYALQGRMDDSRKLFERLLSVANDVGLLAEEYDPVAQRLLGNFPQAYSHVSLVNTARNLVPAGPALHRSRAASNRRPPLRGERSSGRTARARRENDAT